MKKCPLILLQLLCRYLRNLLLHFIFLSVADQVVYTPDIRLEHLEELGLVENLVRQQRDDLCVHIFLINVYFCNLIILYFTGLLLRKAIVRLLPRQLPDQVLAHVLEFLGRCVSAEQDLQVVSDLFLLLLEVILLLSLLLFIAHAEDHLLLVLPIELVDDCLVHLVGRHIQLALTFLVGRPDKIPVHVEQVLTLQDIIHALL